MPLVLGSSTASLDTCNGAINERGKRLYTLTGASSILSVTLRNATDAAENSGFEIGHILSLVEASVVRGKDLEHVEYFAVLFDGSQFEQWLDGCCAEVAAELAEAASRGAPHVVATRKLLADGAEKLFLAGKWPSREFELDATEFVATEDLWIAACAREADPAAAEAATVKELPAGLRGLASKFTMDLLVDEQGGGGAASLREVELASGARLKAVDAARAAEFVLTTL